MVSITIRRLGDATKERLRVRASHHARSMEAEAREILTVALRGRGAAEGNLAESIQRRFAALGGVEFAELPREPKARRWRLAIRAISSIAASLC